MLGSGPQSALDSRSPLPGKWPLGAACGQHFFIYMPSRSSDNSQNYKKEEGGNPVKDIANRIKRKQTKNLDDSSNLA